MKEITTNNVMSWPSNVSMMILLMVGDGVNVFNTFTSESHEGCRCLYELAVTFEVANPALEELTGKRVENPFLIKVSITGSSVENVNSEDIGDFTDGESVAIDVAPVEIAELVADTTVSARMVPLSRLPNCKLPPPGHRPSANQKSALQIALIDHGSHPSQTNATRTNRNHVTTV